MGLKVGFSGTRYGMTVGQMAALERLLRDLAPAELHHGDCVGADETAASIAWRLGSQLVAHPPANPRLRGLAGGIPGTVVMPAAEYLDRNAHIVNACDVLVAAPCYGSERRRSGTWATVRYARKVGKPRFVVPAEDGWHIVYERPDDTRSYYFPSGT